ncbi:carbonic anhydrase, partial [Entophlyctis helioformis]
SGCPRKLDVQQLLNNNRAWAYKKREDEPAYFKKLAEGQSPAILWIGCSDSRVPPTEILRLGPGDAFVHRNIANVVVTTDLSFLSVLQYAVDVLKVDHVIVCGHYSCGGVHSAMTGEHSGLIDNWLEQIRDLRRSYKEVLSRLRTDQQREDLMCELNVLQSLSKVAANGIVQGAWARGQRLVLHGWCYRLSDGVIRDLGLVLDSNDRLQGRIEAAMAARVRPRG